MTNKKEGEKLTKDEIGVLTALASNTDTWGARCIGFDYILGEQESRHLTRRELSKICKSLREKELVHFYRGLMTDDGEVAGSGYCISKKGRDLADTLKL